MRTFPLVCLLPLHLLSACGREDVREWKPTDHDQPEAAEDPVPVADEPSERPTAPQDPGLALWRMHCVRCHGPEGEGGPVPGGNSVAADLRGSTRTRAEVEDQIVKGKGDMPSFQNLLRPEDVSLLVDRVLALRRRPPAAD